MKNKILIHAEPGYFTDISNKNLAGLMMELHNDCKNKTGTAQGPSGAGGDFIPDKASWPDDNDLKKLTDKGNASDLVRLGAVMTSMIYQGNEVFLHKDGSCLPEALDQFNVIVVAEKNSNAILNGYLREKRSEDIFDDVPGKAGLLKLMVNENSDNLDQADPYRIIAEEGLSFDVTRDKTERKLNDWFSRTAPPLAKLDANMAEKELKLTSGASSLQDLATATVKRHLGSAGQADRLPLPGALKNAVKEAFGKNQGKPGGMRR
jgi:hypothetical protein